MKNKFGYRIIIWVAIFYLTLGGHDLSWAEGKKLLLFAQDPTFLPKIETILYDLRDYQTNDSIFSNIVNLNKWSINRLELGDLVDLIRFYESSPELRRKSKEALKMDALLCELVQQSDTYIRINVLPKGSLLEFQLIITDSLPKVEKNEFPIIVTEKSRYAGFVIDISREDYEYQLENSLKSLFPNSNRPPIPIVKLNTEKNEDGYYYFGVGRAAILDASESYDLDTPPEHLRFHWAQKNPNDDHKPVPENEIVPIDVSSKKQVLSFASKGEYHFGLTVSDEIADSKEEIIKIRVIDPPRLSSKSHYSFKSKGFLSKHRFRIPFSIVRQEGEIVQPRILPAHIRINRPSLLRRIIGNPESQTLDTSKYQVNYLSSLPNGRSQKDEYELVVEEESGFPDYQYEFLIVGESDKCLSDTLPIITDFHNRYWGLRGDLINFMFFGEKDTVHTQKRVLAFRLGMNFPVYKEISLVYGKIMPLFKEDIEDSLDIFDIPESYVSLNCSYISIPIYLSKGKSGIGYSMDIGRMFGLFPLSTGVVRYGHENYSANVSSGFELSPSWTPEVIVGFLLFMSLSFHLGF